MHSPLRSAARATALLTPLVLALTIPSAASASPPITWEEPPPMSALQALLLFGGVPLGLFVLITALTIAPSVARGGDQRGVDRWATPQWFHSPGAEATSVGSDQEQRALIPGHAHTDAGPGTDAGPARDVVPVAAPTGGGASARW